MTRDNKNTAKRNVQTWSKQELSFLKTLKTPEKIQKFLDDISYHKGNGVWSAREVLIHGEAHCFDGALFAAAAFRIHGVPPLLMDLKAVHDTDHVLAIFRKNGRWGAVSKSNYTGLGYRDPVYKDLRELAMSFFEHYYNLRKEKTLRQYSLPFDLRKVDSLNWTFSNKKLETLAHLIDGQKHFNLLTPAMTRALLPVRERVFKAGKLGAVKERKRTTEGKKKNNNHARPR